jgi:hypothetical protein
MKRREIKFVAGSSALAPDRIAAAARKTAAGTTAERAISRKRVRKNAGRGPSRQR